MQKSLSLLLIEDDPDIRELLAEFLNMYGHSLALAANGREGLSYLRQTEKMPDVILLDLMMPVMNGEVFRKEQMNDERISHVPVIVLSADSQAHQRLESLCFNKFLEKPIDLDRLLILVQETAKT